jgi:hypothetical protein
MNIPQTKKHWETVGIRFRVEDSLGAEDIQTSELVYPKLERLVLDKAPLFLVTALDLAMLRENEEEVIKYLKGKRGHVA